MRATGLNLIDVLDALGMLPFDRVGELGGECAGEIVAVGTGVSGYRVGQRVAALAWGCFSSYVTVSTDLVMPLPDSLGFEEAATIPISFATAWYALRHVGHLSAGERVLIHAAAGGLGMAACQVARQIGAEVFATASSAKWGVLRSMGIRHVYGLRTLDFADQILADTDGRGVDVVLNSLTGEGFIEKGLTALCAGGRFLEVGKRDVRTVAEMDALRPDVDYHLVDLRRIINGDPARARDLLQDLAPEFADGRLAPLPRTIFPIEGIVDAFRHMQQARHVGKIVVTPTARPSARVDRDGTYLITGGLGGLGLLMADWLVRQGAGRLMLIGRRGPTPEVERHLKGLRELGPEVMVARADVTDYDRLAACLDLIDDRKPLRGVIHAAGVLDDGALLQQDWARFSAVLGPKVRGAWNLHALTRGRPLDFFVLFSSAAGLIGNRGQSNYAAANAFLDAFASHIRSHGVPAMSIGWGPWAELGAAAELVRRRGAADVPGQGAIAPDEGLALFSNLLAEGSAYVAVLPIEWAKFLDRRDAVPRFFAELVSEPAPGRLTMEEHPGGLAQEWERTPAKDRLDFLGRHVRAATAKVLGLRTPDRIDPRRGFTDQGVDSLMAVELRNDLASRLGQPLPATLIFDYPTPDALIGHLAGDVLPEAGPMPSPGGQSGGIDPMEPEGDVSSLSEEEAAKRLAYKLDQMGF